MNVAFGIDEPLDEPRARDPIDMNVLARRPGSLSVGSERLLLFRDASRVPGAREAPLEDGERGGRGLTARRAEEVERHDLFDAFLQAGEVRLGRSTGVVLLSLDAELVERGPHLLADLPVVSLASGAKERFDVLVLQALDEGRVAKGRLSPFFHDLAGDPLEVFALRVRGREHVDAVLDRDGADPGETLADLRAKVRRLRRNRVDQE